MRHMLRRRLEVARGDSGALLVFALIIITTVALVTGVVLIHAATNARATVTLRGVANTSYAADAAAKVAINDLRLGSSDSKYFVQSSSTVDDAPWVYSNNIDGTGCFGLTGSAAKNTLELPSLQPKSGRQAAATSARVECSVVQGTGLFGGGGGVETDGSMRAITTFGDLTVENNSTLQVRGGIASNGSIDADNAAGTGIFTNGYVWANAGCSGNITSNPAKDCSHADVSDPTFSEVFTSTAGVVVRNALTQVCGSFKPGYYASAKELTDAVELCGTAVFEPGDYYFDFVDEANSTGNNVWTINKTVIAGQTSGSGEPPGRCVSPIDDTSAIGVRFVFGGNSRIVVGQDAHVEICGTYADDTVPVVIQQQGVSTSSSATTSVLKSTSAPATTGSVPAWTAAPTAAMIDKIDASDAQWPGSNANNAKGVLTLTGFTTAPTVPSGSRLTGATLKIHHKEVGGTQITVKMSVGGDSYTVSPTLRSVATLNQAYPSATTDDLVIPAGPLLTALTKAVRDGTLSNTVPTVEISLAGKNKAMAIDSVALDLAYTTWALHAAVDNDFLTGFGNSFKGDFVLQGTLYAPHGNINVNFGNNVGTVVAFRYGLAVRSALLAGHPQVLYGYPLVSIPDTGTGLGRRVTVVDLKVYVCVEQTACASGGDHALTVRVMIKDPPWSLGSEPVPGKRQMTVLSWAEQK